MSRGTSLLSGRRSASTILLLICATAMIAWGVPSRVAAGATADPGLIPRRVEPKGLIAAPRAGFDRSDRIVVKFREGTAIRLRGASLTTLDPSVDIGPLSSWLAAHPGIQVARHFSRPEADLDAAREAGERKSGRQLADLNLYYQLRLSPGDRGASSVASLLAQLRALPIVETAFVEPVPEPAAAEPRSATMPGISSLLSPNPRPRLSKPSGLSQSPGLPQPATPDFSGMQGYLYASPVGVNAQAVWGNPGGRGATVRLIDIEGAWLWTHEDLKVPFFTGGTPIDDLDWRNHGTAVMGEMVGRNDGSGVTGIASDLSVGGVSIGSMGVADAIDMAAAHESPGDLFLIELHAPGPNANGSGQYGYVPMEFWQDNFDAIQTAVANGRICIEAAGNGQQNLDDPIYEGLFDRNVRNSGAIMVGAGTPTGLDAEWFTNYGSRLDLQGWGDSVTTTGYGDLQGGLETQWYTAYFSGTSSASPIVAGSVASLQGMSKALWGIALDGPLAAQILFDTGSPWNGAQRIGNRPNLLAAYARLQQGIGTVSGTVRDAVTNQPIPNARILIVEMNSLFLTDANGNYEVPLESGTYTFRVSEFFHATDEETVTVVSGQNMVQDFNLAPAPTGYAAGTVTDIFNSPIVGATVRLLGTPIPPVQSDGSGDYLIDGVPAGSVYDGIFGLVPTYGAAWQTFSIVAGQGTVENAELPPAETFEQGGGAYTPDYPWQLGTPTNPNGPGGAFSGTKLWAIGLTSNYPDNTTAYLTSHVLDPTGLPTLYLSFTQWYDTEEGFDGGNVQVNMNDGQGWITVTPVGGYPMSFLDGLGYQDGWSGRSGGWQPAFFDLSPYRNSHLNIRFHFGSDAGVNGPGWFIDDVSIYVGQPPTAVGDPTASATKGVLLPARPNPFSDGSEIRFRLPTGPADASARLRIVDAGGRIVRDLTAASRTQGLQSIRWDGKDQIGRAAPAGVYYYTLEVNGKIIGRRAIVRVR